MGTNTKTGVWGYEGRVGGGKSKFQHQTNILSGTMKNEFERLLE